MIPTIAKISVQPIKENKIIAFTFTFIIALLQSVKSKPRLNQNVNWLFSNIMLIKLSRNQKNTVVTPRHPAVLKKQFMFVYRTMNRIPQGRIRQKPVIGQAIDKNQPPCAYASQTNSSKNRNMESIAIQSSALCPEKGSGSQT